MYFICILAIVLVALWVRHSVDDLQEEMHVLRTRVSVLEKQDVPKTMRKVATYDAVTKLGG